jgi:hypothetical protein
MLCKRKKSKYCGLAEALNPQITKNCVYKSQIRQVENLRKVMHKSNKLFKPASLRISDLQNLFVDHPPLPFLFGMVRYQCRKFFYNLLEAEIPQ